MAPAQRFRPANDVTRLIRPGDTEHGLTDGAAGSEKRLRLGLAGHRCDELSRDRRPVRGGRDVDHRLLLGDVRLQYHRQTDVFFVPDLSDYAETMRGTYFDLGSRAPGPLVSSTEAVGEAIQAAARTAFPLSMSRPTEPGGPSSTRSTMVRRLSGRSTYC